MIPLKLNQVYWKKVVTREDITEFLLTKGVFS